VSRVGERRNVYSVLVGQTEGKIPLKNLNVNGSIILKCICIMTNVMHKFLIN
jgi:hypothetical protein